MTRLVYRPERGLRRGAVGAGDGHAETVRGATGDARPMDERSDAAGRRRRPWRRRADGTCSGTAGTAQRRHGTRPTAHRCPGRTAGRQSGERPRGTAVPAAGIRRRAGRCRSSLLALVCGGYAVGAALGWGSPRLALIMGDFGLSAAAAHRRRLLLRSTPARGGSRFRPAWLLFALSSAMAALGNARLGLVRGRCCGQAVPQPLRCADLVLPLLRAARHRRPARPRQAARSPGPAGSAWGSTPG